MGVTSEASSFIPLEGMDLMKLLPMRDAVRARKKTVMIRSRWRKLMRVSPMLTLAKT